MNKADRELLKTHTAVRHQRFGNEVAWSVRGGTMRRGQIVTTHAMCSEVTAIKKAIKQDDAEHAANACPNFTDVVGTLGKPLRCGTKLFWPCVNHEEILLCPICIKNAEWVKGNPETKHWPNNQNTGGAESERS